RVLFLPPNNPKFNFDEAKLPLNFDELFERTRMSNARTNRRNSPSPIKLEVCSGHGDWVVDRAFHDKSSNWVSLEMRYDRVFNIWSKMLFADLDNLLILGGEAHSIFQQCIPDESITEVYVNFPDPPVWKGSSQRLLSKTFLREVHRVLKPGCSVI